MGKIGILICADSGYPDGYKILERERVDYILVPSYLPPRFDFNKRFPGYVFSDPAMDRIDKEDIGKISVIDAWLKYGMAGRMKKAGIRTGLNVFLKGDFLGLGSGGASVVVKDDFLHVGKLIKGSSIVNLLL